jgi:orotate phosphoribosyltransferase
MKILKQADQFAYHYAAEGLTPTPGPRPPMSAQEKSALPHWNETRDALRDIGGRWRDTPVTLKDGRQTNVYLDPKNVFSTNRHMTNLSRAMLAHADALGLDYNAVGGPTMGADVVSHGMVAHHPNPDMGWFTVRDRPKSDHGLGKWIEGTEVGPNHKVILTDDVADSGRSLVDAYHKVRSTGAQVAAVMPVVDRADQTGPQFEQLGVPYHPLMRYEDLGINSLTPPSHSTIERGGRRRTATLRWQPEGHVLISRGATHDYLIDPPHPYLSPYQSENAENRAQFGSPDQHLLFTFPHDGTVVTWQHHSSHPSQEDAQGMAETHNNSAGP